jgi:hypothetical protein
VVVRSPIVDCPDGSQLLQLCSNQLDQWRSVLSVVEFSGGGRSVRDEAARSRPSGRSTTQWAGAAKIGISGAKIGLPPDVNRPGPARHPGNRIDRRRPHRREHAPLPGRAHLRRRPADPADAQGAKACLNVVDVNGTQRLHLDPPDVTDEGRKNFCVYDGPNSNARSGPPSSATACRSTDSRQVLTYFHH